MAGRPRRKLRQVDYRRLHLIGMDDDSTEDELSEAEDTVEDSGSELDEDAPSDEECEHHHESESDSESDTDVSTGSMVGRDGSVWKTELSMSQIPGWLRKRTTFDDGPKGLAKTNLLTAANTFQLMMTEDVLQDICHWTNKYATRVVNKYNTQHPERNKTWLPLNIVELRAYMGLILLGGIEKAKKKPWFELWSTNDAIRCPLFPATLSRDRFYSITSMLRFDNVFVRRAKKLEAERSSVASTSASKKKKLDPTLYDTLSPIKDIFTRVTSTYDTLFEPFSKLCIDEQVVKFRGNCPFRVYMPQKPGKYGIKVWACVDVVSGFILNLQVYQGQIESIAEVGQGQRVVMDLTSKYYGSRREVIADNFFSSISLVKLLLEKKLSYCGTLRKNRKEIPPVIKDLETADAESSMFLFNESANATLVRYLPTKSTYVLLLSSTHHDKKTVITKKGKVKPKIIDYYNTWKCGVDTADQMIGAYTCQFPSRRWSMKLFFHLLDCCALNAYVIFLRNNATWKESTKSRRRFFIRKLAYELIVPQINFRAEKVSNFPSHIRSAMLTMGVHYGPIHKEETSVRRQPCNVSDGTNLQGRCPFDGVMTKDQRVSRRECKQCQTFICKEHWKFVCPTCLNLLVALQSRGEAIEFYAEEVVLGRE